MSNRAISGGSSSGGSGSGAPAYRAQPSLAGFYDWSSNITGCVQVSQYHQTDQQHQQYYQQQQQQQQQRYQHQQQHQQAEASGSAQVFPVRRPSKATLAKMRQYYNPGMKLLQAGRPADAAWREAGQLTKGERHLAMARAGRQALLLAEPPELQAVPPARTRLDSSGQQCRCSYDPRLYPVYTSRSQGPMCVVCKLRRPQRRLESDWAEEEEEADVAALAMRSGGGAEEEEERARAPPSTPRRRAAGRTTSVVAMRDGSRKATLDVFLPNAEREPASPLPRPSCCDSALSQRTLTSPEPPLALETPPR